MSARVLVAGVGNVFFGDDGFGPSVVSRLDRGSLPDTVDVIDYGIRGVHLAYDVLDGQPGSLILVDAVPMGDVPGALQVMKVDDPARFGEQIDAHAMSPATVLRALSALGACVPDVWVVGCQPGALDTGMVLSTPVEASVDEAVRLVSRLALDECARHEPLATGKGG